MRQPAVPDFVEAVIGREGVRSLRRKEAFSAKEGFVKIFGFSGAK